MKRKINSLILRYYGIFVALTFIPVHIYVNWSEPIPGEYYRSRGNQEIILVACIHMIIASLYALYSVYDAFWGKDDDEDGNIG